jgi:hypothetical protein
MKYLILVSILFWQSSCVTPQEANSSNSIENQTQESSSTEFTRDAPATISKAGNSKIVKKRCPNYIREREGTPDPSIKVGVSISTENIGSNSEIEKTINYDCEQ